jgi:hypothetical protein
MTGPNPRSYRAEAHAIAAILLCIAILHKVVPFLATSYEVVELYSDNQGLVDKVSEMMAWETHYPSNALLSEWDILSVILAYIPKLPMPPTVKHVKSGRSRCNAISSRPAQL